jgi:hypothetical protein
MFGIALMGVLTNAVQMCTGLVAEISAACTSCCGIFGGIPLGLAQACGFYTSLTSEICVTCMRALTCGLCF